MTQVTCGVPLEEELVRYPDAARVLRPVTALVAVASAAAHVVLLTGSAAAPPAHLLVLAAMAMVCLPCALHLLLLPRRRAWVQTGAVSASMLVVHPLVAGGHGPHGTAPALTMAMTALPALGLALALAGLALGTRVRGAGGRAGRRPPPPHAHPGAAAVTPAGQRSAAATSAAASTTRRPTRSTSAPSST